ncbi:DNA translocase SpoIIIE [bioreactor metagenome]|uniref:DNA translocase SpoIIIE n=1 Tax=bioreactor metagenome TaxID=1076179 RepID=A0A645GL91_9ZZZZ
MDVITGIIKANIPSRISFAVSSQVDSRTILDMAGAEKLLGKGDMLYSPSGMSKPIRVQGCFVSDKEVELVVEFVKTAGAADYSNEILEHIENDAQSLAGGGKDQGESDELFFNAAEVVVDAGQASVSLLQRRLKLGYARAARIVDEMEERGIVGPYEGSKPRQVLISRQQFLEMKFAAEKGN